MKSILAALASSVVLTLAAPAGARPGYAVAPPVTPARVDKIDESVAVGLSLGGTAVSWGMLLVGAQTQNDGLSTLGAIGTMVGPSLGHWYSRKAFSRGLGLRTLGLGAATVAFALVLDDLFDEDSDDEGTASALLLLGAGLYLAGTVDDIATAGSAAREYNARFENVTLVPTANKHGGGFALVGRF